MRSLIGTSISIPKTITPAQIDPRQSAIGGGKIRPGLRRTRKVHLDMDVTFGRSAKPDPIAEATMNDL
jgi:hypothetical protein